MSIAATQIQDLVIELLAVPVAYKARNQGLCRVQRFVIHRWDCPQECSFTIPEQPDVFTRIQQNLPLLARTGKEEELHVRVWGDYRTDSPYKKEFRAVAKLLALLQQRLGRPLQVTEHSAFEGRGTPEECPGHKFFVALRKLKQWGCVCPPFILK